MAFSQSVKNALAPIHREGYPFVGGAALATLILFWLWPPVGWIGLILTCWAAYFFRDPTRVTPAAEGLVVSPADGRIAQVTNAVPPPELKLGEEALPRVSIFMSVLDVHVNRSPIGGRVARIVYTPGKFINADLDKASEDNERNSLVITDGKHSVAMVQIAGLIARRIVCFVQEGATVAPGERVGIIRFGSRVDVYLPAGVRPLVAQGQTALGGETVIADIGHRQPKRAFRVA
jgi:phosphatidylserine decarboxylase